MAQDRGSDRRTLSALATLLPAGTVGLSVSLAAAGARATAIADPEVSKPGTVAERLQSIRDSVSGAIDEHRFLKVDPDQRLAWWGNGWHNGWHNGGWGNGGWHNGGWGNGGWHNGGWGNGGWGNGLLPFLFGSPWGNGWHNWGNGWHNW